MNNQLIIYSSINNYIKFNNSIILLSKISNLDDYYTYCIIILYNVYIYYISMIINIY